MSQIDRILKRLNLSQIKIEIKVCQPAFTSTKHRMPGWIKRGVPKPRMGESWISQEEVPINTEVRLVSISQSIRVKGGID